ncbi:response regulator [Derxia lacustris]|uniref:response regulator n=1 Tax=Derxia lacustris TaxID=764842 RepID=UPI000A174283|nr:response regulator [Derxia lacustris]
MADILIIEDHPANADLLTYLLGVWGHDCRVAADAEAGWQAALARRPDLILCDIQLPGMSGDAFVRAARAEPRLADVPIVALTAFAMLGDRERLLAEGFDDYLAKPIEPEGFVERIGMHLGRARRPSAAPPVPHTAPAVEPRASAIVRERVLVVDDVADNLSIVTSCLTPLGYRVRTAATVEQGIALAREEVPDLIISDVGMGTGSGFDFIRQVKDDARLRGVPFVFITSTRWEQSARLRALQLGAVRYLLRPIDSRVLLAEVEAVLG